MQDREGSVILVTGGDGTILESYRYDAFGTPTMKKPDGTIITTGASLINNRFLFTGREYAAQYGFYEYRARAYHPSIGRFMSEDPTLFVRGAGLRKPVTDSGGSKGSQVAGATKSNDEWSFSKHPDEAEWNLFRYCHNDPANLIDPMGLDLTYLLDSKAVLGTGHAGVIVGQPAGDRFTYHSYYPKTENSAIGKSTTEKKVFTSYGEAMAYAKKQGYDRFARFEADAVQDKSARQEAKAFKGSQYNGVANNCQDLVNAMMRAADVPFVGKGSTPVVSFKQNLATAAEHGQLK